MKDLDVYLGQLRKLTAKHLSEDQLFVFSSDHGAQFPFGKWTLYDEGIRVPLIVARKGMIAPDRRTEAMVSWIGIMPTLIEIGGGDVPEDLDGRSFIKVLRGESGKHRKRIFTTVIMDDLSSNFLISAPIRLSKSTLPVILNMNRFRKRCMASYRIGLKSKVIS